jgi:hypothetical protein
MLNTIRLAVFRLGIDRFPPLAYGERVLQFLVMEGSLMFLLFQLLFFLPTGEQAPSIDSLIKQLGSQRYRNREAATKALQGAGVKALSALRKAAARSDDPEIRFRAERLVLGIELREVEIIRQVNLSNAEKYQRVSKLLEKGMNMEHLQRILGPAKYRGRDCGADYMYFEEYRLLVTVGYRGKVLDFYQMGQ